MGLDVGMRMPPMGLSSVSYIALLTMFWIESSCYALAMP
jgi:hypothetical protein